MANISPPKSNFQTYTEPLVVHMKKHSELSKDENAPDILEDQLIKLEKMSIVREKLAASHPMLYLWSRKDRKKEIPTYIITSPDLKEIKTILADYLRDKQDKEKEIEEDDFEELAVKLALSKLKKVMGGGKFKLGLNSVYKAEMVLDKKEERSSEEEEKASKKKKSNKEKSSEEEEKPKKSKKATKKEKSSEEEKPKKSKKASKKENPESSEEQAKKEKNSVSSEDKKKSNKKKKIVIKKKKESSESEEKVNTKKKSSKKKKESSESEEKVNTKKRSSKKKKESSESEEEVKTKKNSKKKIAIVKMVEKITIKTS
jgi:DNA polymerase III gamma/tau subunit